MGCLGNKVVEAKGENRINNENNIKSIENENQVIEKERENIEEERKKLEEERKKLEEERKKLENERKKREEDGRKREEEEDERKKREEDERKKREEEERKKREEDERKKREEDERKKKEEERKRKKQKEESLEGESERKKNEERVIKEETERIKKETEQKLKIIDEKFKTVQEKIKSEEEEKVKKDEKEGRWTKYKKVGGEYRTKKEIRDYLLPLLKYENSEVIFDTQPKVTSPYLSGKISKESLDIGFKMLNYARYAVGIPNNVINDSSYEKLAQDASLLQRVNNLMAHTGQPKPRNMNDNLYKSGAKGCAKCNLFTGPRNLYDAVDGWLRDDGNFYTIGHRRWIINPPMQKSGFGKVGQYYAMYCPDNAHGETEYSNIPWPCRNMALEFGTTDHWTLSVGKEVSDDVVVTITNNRTGKIKKLSKQNNKEFYISNQYYGQIGCIIFENPYKYTDGDSFRVDVKGKDLAVSYDVNFFNVVCHHKNQIVETIKPSCIMKGKNINCCESCGLKSEDIIDTISHKYKLQKEIASTCSEKGKKINVCEFCYKKFEEEIDFLPHNYKCNLLDEKTGKSEAICQNCNYKINFTAPTYLELLWRNSDISSNSYTNNFPYQNRIHSKLVCWITEMNGDEEYNDVIIEVSDNNLIEVPKTKIKKNSIVELNLKELGEATITIYPKYNPNLKIKKELVIKKEIDNNYNQKQTNDNFNNNVIYNFSNNNNLNDFDLEDFNVDNYLQNYGVNLNQYLNNDIRQLINEAKRGNNIHKNMNIQININRNYN